MKTFLDIGYSSGIFWRCVGDPAETPGQSCTRIPTFQIAAAIGLLCLVILIAVILSRRRRRT
jgi:hypothetical protein